MIELDVTMEGVPIEADVVGLTAQLPYAMSRAINFTLESAQQAIQQRLPMEFTLRRADFITRTIYIAPADRARKDRLVGTVRVNPQRDFLAKFEDGGEKRSTTGRSLAVPILREGSPSIIIGRGDPLNVKMLMAAISAGHGKVFKTRRSKGGLRVTTDPNRVFLVQSAKGTFIVQRTGTGSTRVLYAFRAEVPIKPELHFDDTAMAAALAHWDENWTRALDIAIATMR